MKIFIIAGEESGDQLGAAVLNALKQQDANLQIRGIGGAEMRKAGLAESFFPMEELSLMGIAEILPEIPNMLKKIRQTVDAVKVYNPDIVLSIDCPEFSLRVQKALSKTACRAKRIHMVAPTVWAWRPKRAAEMARYLDGIMCLYPFEPPYFEKEGLRSAFIGHTMMGSGILDGNGSGFRFRHMIGHDQKVLGLFFGSRSSEIERNADLIIDVAGKLKHDNPDLCLLVPTIYRWKNVLRQKLESRGLDCIVTDDAHEKWDSFAACDAALAVSGTVALEIAVVGVPHVITYQMNKVTWALLRKLVKTKFAHLANIIFGREAVPEFVQEKANADRILPVIKELLYDNHLRQAQKEDFKTVRSLLKPDANKNPADEAAGFILSYLSA